MLARRSIQKLLDQSIGYLSPNQLDRFVTHLKRHNPDSVEAEWELIMLAALASLGNIEHEPDLGGSSRLDIRLRSPQAKFIADVRVVSDEQYHRQNPVQEFSNKLSNVAENLRSEGIQGGFDYRVNGIAASVWERRYKTKLVLPLSHEFKRVIFNRQFKAFVDAIRRDPGKSHTFAMDTKEASVSIVFSPRRGGFQSGSYLAYNVAHDYTHNVVWRALEDKSDQLKRAGPRASGELGGVFLCDGGCGMLRSLPNVHTLTVGQIIDRFLRKSATADFVCVVDVVESTNYGCAAPLRFEARLWSIRERAWAQRFSANMDSALQGLPPPQASAINTLNHFKWARDRQSFYGRYKRDSTMTHNSLAVSLRAVMDYLAGRIDRKEFENIVHPDWLVELRNRLDQGRAIENIVITRSPGQDDDDLVITFGGHDAAKSQFRVPTSDPDVTKP
jgi:hypothetical protein